MVCPRFSCPDFLVRSYQEALLSDPSNQGTILLQVDSTALCGWDIFSINLKYAGSKEMYSAAMAAMMAQKKVKIEVKPSSGCIWGQELQSLYIVN